MTQILYMLLEHYQYIKSTDSGNTWTEISEWRGSGFTLPYVHADHHNIVFIDSDKILMSNDGGVFLTTDGGNTFTMKNDNMVTTQFYSTAIHPTDSDYVSWWYSR